MRSYNHVEDLQQINSWLKDRGQAAFLSERLPRLGVIVDDVAVGFLCQTDSSVACLDPFITNKNASSKSRHKALNEIAKWCLERAKDLGFKRCIMMSFEDSLLRRAQDLGFTIGTAGFGFKDLGG